MKELVSLISQTSIQVFLLTQVLYFDFKRITITIQLVYVNFGNKRHRNTVNLIPLSCLHMLFTIFLIELRTNERTTYN